jgi:hypothetical protein
VVEKMLIQFSPTSLIAVPSNIECHSLRLSFHETHIHI